MNESPSAKLRLSLAKLEQILLSQDEFHLHQGTKGRERYEAMLSLLSQAKECSSCLQTGLTVIQNHFNRL